MSGLGCGFASVYFRSETVCFQVPGREQGYRVGGIPHIRPVDFTAVERLTH